MAIKVTDFDTNHKPVCDLLCGNLHPTSHQFPRYDRWSYFHCKQEGCLTLIHLFGVNHKIHVREIWPQGTRNILYHKV